MSNCADCFHPEENHRGICNATLNCLCQKFIPQELFDFAADIEKYKHEAKSIRARVLILIQKLPHLGNDKVSDKTFAKVYKSYWHGFWPSKKTVFTQQKFQEMPESDYINREKRHVLNDLTSKGGHPELKIFNQEAAEKKAAKFQAYVELATIDAT